VALISCPECNRQVSEKAPVCPGCGFPIAGAAQVELHPTSITLSPSPKPLAEPTNPKNFIPYACVTAILLITVEIAKSFYFAPSRSTGLSLAASFGSAAAVFTLPLIAAALAWKIWEKIFVKVFFISLLALGVPISVFSTIGQLTHVEGSPFAPKAILRTDGLYEAVDPESASGCVYLRFYPDMTLVAAKVSGCNAGRVGLWLKPGGNGARGTYGVSENSLHLWVRSDELTLACAGVIEEDGSLSEICTGLHVRIKPWWKDEEEDNNKDTHLNFSFRSDRELSSGK
jgi:hypothetical protein